MKRHTRIYLDAMRHDESDWIGCEIIGCEMQSVDIHHIRRKGMGGSRREDYIENIMSICRHHHEKYGDRKQYMDFLKYCHQKRMEERQVKYNPELIKNDFV